MTNPMDLTGRSILVTGASSGIGRETSILLSRLGARLVLVGRNEQRLSETASRLEGTGHRAECFDLTKFEDVPPWMKRLVAELGPFHGLVHSAGVQVASPLRFLKRSDVEEVMNINFLAAVGLTQGFRQKGVYAKPGSVVFVSSVVGSVGQPGISAYAGSKGAIRALTKSLALELVRDGIRVNCVAPGHVETEMSVRFRQSLTPEQVANIDAMHPLGIGQPLDVAYAIAFLLADTARWITGTELVVDGGYTAH